MNFIYWNIAKKLNHAVLSRLVAEHDADFVVLSECPPFTPEDLFKFNNDLDRKLGLVYSTQNDPVILTTLSLQNVDMIADSNGIVIRLVKPYVGKEFLLVAIHLQSKLFKSLDDQTQIAFEVASTIIQAEERTNNRRTVVLGDFNMNPFEAGMVGASTLHAIMAKHVVEKQFRYVNGKKKFFFYNPMWSHFGEHPTPPGGSYFYSSAHEVNHYWNIFDQVLLRPDLLNEFEEETLQILSSIGQTSLLNAKNIPDRNGYSDHLPITFRINLLKGIT